jgi:hypothetical protein
VSPLDLEAIEARADAAVPGPWEMLGPSKYSPNEAYIKAPIEIYTGYEGEMSPADVQFIAHARTDVPALCAEVRRLRGLLVEAAEEMAAAEGLLANERWGAIGRYRATLAKIQSEVKP